MHVRPHVDLLIHFVITWLEEFIFTCTASLRILAASTNTTLNFDNLLAFSPLTQTHLDFRNAVWYATCNNLAKPWIDFDSYDASLSWGFSGTTWIYNHFPSHIKYFGSHIPIVTTKFWNNCNLLGGLTTQAQHWILTLYLQIFLWLTNIQIWILDIAIWCNPAQNLQLKRFCQKPGTSLFASNILWLCVFWVHTYLYMYINEPTKILKYR